MPAAAEYYGSEDAWKQLVDRDDLDLVYVVTDWKNHAPMGIYAMKKGKHVAIEVPAAMTLEEIWDLINTSEKTRKHCMGDFCGVFRCGLGTRRQKHRDSGNAKKMLDFHDS